LFLGRLREPIVARATIRVHQPLACTTKFLYVARMDRETACGRAVCHKVACVIGWPVAHSRSPLIHGYWIKELGLDADYRREAVAPEAFAEFATHLAEHGYVGANVTVPHKEAALALAKPDALATAVGAVNTLWLEDGVLYATNTDVEGFIASLDAAVPGWAEDRRHVVVLGAGGAARAVVFGLLQRGVTEVRLANRNIDRANATRERFGNRVVACRWEVRNQLLSGASLLVNTTTLGMAGQEELTIDLAALGPDAIVADIVYAPLTTPLLAAARARGLRTVDGLGMLLNQAAGAFARFFGTRPQVTQALRTLVEADLIQH
jgi:shikimate dehydrogenase